ncbi:glycoside hydrolase family 43 protein [Pelagicoccus enzymogenes]|uniref:glycoside hydrolase family 43 protein n=1 Tax=Pelagicoccus enzymogenes TaxID=2773457 RepID=UPI00280CDE5E|nr:glycoside hydrolase family 43 protein [Pelagicoccus enzymogenes]MDQ8199762.1 glycoside hydrolase family 43 protein [Pelagicoccus enzymogenes]
MNPTLQNPILPGFNPDPSLIAVGNDFYIATSTFEWFPGVQIHHSTDLANWQLVSRPLERTSQLDMTGNPDSGGVWAPCLSHCDDTFFLVFTDVKEMRSSYKASRSYLVTSKRIDGDWSDPIHLPVSGFDQSLFHAPDGRKFLTWLVWDDRPGVDPFGGIMLQEYDHPNNRLLGKPRKIFSGTEIGRTEGPHLYWKDGYYYLMTAEGGTGWEHAVSLARSRDLYGPYETCPHNPILTSHRKHEATLKRAGHGSIAQAPNGRWYLAHLCSRPIPHRGCSTMGRETALQEVEWTADGWLQLTSENNAPASTVALPQPATQTRNRSQLYSFDTPALPSDFQTLRLPLDEKRLSLTERPGFLRLRGELPFCTRGPQSLVARRQQAARYTATTCVDFSPSSFQERAGLVCYYSSENYYYAAISQDEALGRVLLILSAHNSLTYQFACDPVPIPTAGSVYLRAEVDYEHLDFSYSLDGENWTAFGPTLDYSILSDESAGAHENFTGSFVGLCCQDLTGNFAAADFPFLDYQEHHA